MREEKFQYKRKHEVSAFEAKTHFSEFLAKVASGEEFTITRYGQKIAMLIPFCAKEKHELYSRSYKNNQEIKIWHYFRAKPQHQRDAFKGQKVT